MADYSAINMTATNVVKVNAVVHIQAQSDTLNPENTEETAALVSLDEDSWQKLANINTFKITPETEDDEIEYYNPDTLNRIKDPQTSILRRNIEMGVVNYPVLFDAIVKGVPNPLSAESQAALSAGNTEGAQLFASNDPYVHVAIRITLYNASQQKLQTMYFYGKLKATSEVEYNGKTMQPTIEVEVQQSPYNRMINEVTLTKQTETPGA